jgi:hypothetical protein
MSNAFEKEFAIKRVLESHEPVLVRSSANSVHRGKETEIPKYYKFYPHGRRTNYVDVFEIESPVMNFIIELIARRGVRDFSIAGMLEELPKKHKSLYEECIEDYEKRSALLSRLNAYMQNLIRNGLIYRDDEKYFHINSDRFINFRSKSFQRI